MSRRASLQTLAEWLEHWPTVEDVIEWTGPLKVEEDAIRAILSGLRTNDKAPASQYGRGD
jgi:hypothetical protein